VPIRATPRLRGCHQLSPLQTPSLLLATRPPLSQALLHHLAMPHRRPATSWCRRCLLQRATRRRRASCASPHRKPRNRCLSIPCRRNRRRITWHLMRLISSTWPPRCNWVACRRLFRRRLCHQRRHSTTAPCRAWETTGAQRSDACLRIATVDSLDTALGGSIGGARGEAVGKCTIAPHAPALQLRAGED